METLKLKEGNVFLGCITHNGQLDYRMANMFFTSASKERAILTKIQQSSLLASACNNLWVTALNRRAQDNLKWFAMLHADVVPEPFWVDTLIALAEEHDADVMSAIVPIKGPDGVTSTAISGPDDFVRLTRLTMKQILSPGWPETFDIHGAAEILFDNTVPGWVEKAGGYTHELLQKSKLLVNTGCMVARLDRPWCEQTHFTINDRIEQLLGGKFVEYVEPEDWFFSRRVAEQGGNVMATRKVVVEHIGSVPYKSNKVWGGEQDPHALL
jgi:GT2 family glycosyltransferase